MTSAPDDLAPPARRSRERAVEDWLQTAAVTSTAERELWGPDRAFPRRADLRRAEIRPEARRRASSPPTRPGGLRTQQPTKVTPARPSAAPRSLESTRRVPVRPAPVPQLPLALAPTPSVLPLPYAAHPTRPAGLAVSVRQGRTDSFRPAPPPAVPLAVPVDVPAPSPSAPAAATADPIGWVDPTLTRPVRRRGADPARPVARSSRGEAGSLRGRAHAARLMVLALMVGVEGVAVTALTGMARPMAAAEGEVAVQTVLQLSEGLPATAVLDDAALRRESVSQAQQEAAAAANALEQAGAQKADAALAQARAAAERVRAEAAAKAAAEAAALREVLRDPRALAQIKLNERGWGSQFSCLDALWTKESNWNYRATNPSSGAYGIPQSLPGSKMASAGSDWRTNPVTQIAWGLDYIDERYGSPCAAWSHSQSTGWY